MEMPGWSWMLLVLLLGGERLETWKDPESQHWTRVSAMKVAGSVGSVLSKEITIPL